MIIDCHGHYTTTPPGHQAFRDAQLARLVDSALREPQPPDFSDDEIRESIEANQLRLLRERGGDMTIFSPRASGMQHHVGDEAMAGAWARACNDLIHRVVQLFPKNFVGVCQLPQVPGVPIERSVDELSRCIRVGVVRRLDDGRNVLVRKRHHDFCSPISVAIRAPLE